MKIQQSNIKQNHNTEAGVKVDKCANLPPPPEVLLVFNSFLERENKFSLKTYSLVG